MAYMKDAAGVRLDDLRIAAGIVNPDDVGYDIVPILGQSNAVGRGYGLDATYRDGPDGRVLQFANLTSDYPDEVVAAIDPLWHHQKPAGTVGFPLTFAKRYARTVPPNRTVLLVPCAHGDTGFGSVGTYTWRVGQAGPINLYALAVAQIDKALALPGENRVVVPLWHQGEANNATAPSSYRTDLLAVIDDLRARYGATMPFVLGQMSPAKLTEGSGYAAIDAVHHEIPTLRPHIGMWEAVPLVNSTSDNVHFSAPGQRLNGRTAYAAYLLAKTPAGGIAAAPAVPPTPPPTPGFSDSFNRTDGAIGSTPSGAAWLLTGNQAGTQTWQVQGGGARFVSGATNSFATLDALAANGTLTQVVKNVGAEHIGGLVLRYGDENNYVILQWRQNTTTFRYQLSKRIAGVTTAVGTSAPTVLSVDGDTLAVTLNGSAIEVRLNGGATPIITGTVEEFVANTRHGLWGSNVGSNGSTDSVEFVAA